MYREIPSVKGKIPYNSLGAVIGTEGVGKVIMDSKDLEKLLGAGHIVVDSYIDDQSELYTSLF